ncbi:glutamate--cysteine ligase catalytic subunit [Adelges cooleyi]|uniref:glutamate--cysteine ligase catalytic subunit n=1 Tax=Adelges cooleyi TaxID=133065 RepID=UPI0021800A13|nr:glutamate--cysteine ligase catalytic subunit [Adelges cooleyi]XP_050432480.1 glutamate--cysteine ligase catalytic subunit [Adelges cooleyi]
MGLLTEGHPLSWEETKKLADHVRQHGINQFVNLYHQLMDRKGDILKWGDEVEYIIVKFDHVNKTAKVRLCAQEILHQLNQKELKDPDNVKSLWRPEYGAYMIEGTPGKPYGGLLAHFNIVEANMRYRREEAQQLLGPDEVLMTITNFPRLGCPEFTWPIDKPTPDAGSSRSLFIPDSAIYKGHPRFSTLTNNIRQRRGERVAINIPIFKDKNTPSPFKEDLKSMGGDMDSLNAALPDHVYMDAMAFGMGCCCLQMTFQACCIREARTLYDQLTPLCPILLALTAASPVFRGYLTEVDCRWDVISGSVDCRTRQERGLEPLTTDKFVIPKSRYDSISLYLSSQGEEFNDEPVMYDENIYKKLKNANIDHQMAQHVAHLFIRDTVSLFSEKVHQDDTVEMDHFENIQSTNWQTMRFKPPPPQSTIGWRVEFRPCEVQLTDFENAAIVCFVVLLTRVILSYQLNFIIPISKVDENMRNAQKQSAAQKEKFWFRKNITSPSKATGVVNGTADDTLYTLMSIDEIINGKSGEFPGLIPLIHSYLSSMEVDADTHCTIQQYLKLISKRASCKIDTTASWIRRFITEHPAYKQDSIVSEEINYDLLMTANGIQSGRISCPQLLGDCLLANSKTKETIPPAVQKVYSCTQ